MVEECVDGFVKCVGVFVVNDVDGKNFVVVVGF